MSYEVALIAGADVANLVGLPNLSNLEASEEITLDTFVLSAHQEVFERLRSNGVDPARLTNADRLRRAVALIAVADAADVGQVSGVEGATLRGRGEMLVDRFVPVYAQDADAPRKAAEGFPTVGHLHDAVFFDPDDR